MVGTIIFLAIMGAILGGLWKAATKAGQPGWAFLVPIYNVHVMLKLTGQPSWWLWGIMFIPVYNIVLVYKLMVAIAALYGKSPKFGLGLTLLGFVFWPILGFGDAKFSGASAPGTGFPVIPTAPSRNAA